VQKIATHLIYVETGKAHVFDRLSVFEEWLEHGGDTAIVPLDESSNDPISQPMRSVQPSLSKNKREQIEKEVSSLEKKIAGVEAELAELELSFQNPATGTDWETTHKRYSELKLSLESLYDQLASRWEMMG
jgi:hypothetical protein